MHIINGTICFLGGRIKELRNAKRKAQRNYGTRVEIKINNRCLPDVQR